MGLIVGKLTPPGRKSDIPAVPFKKCFAKKTQGHCSCLSVLDHCIIVGTVASVLRSRLTGPVSELLPAESAVLAACHDIGKVSPGFQKKIFDAELKTNCPDLQKMPLCNFSTNHAEISEAALVSWANENRAGIRHWSRWAQVLGAHHGSRDREPESDNVAPYGGSAWMKERRRLIQRLTEKFGPLPNNPPQGEQMALLGGLICVSDWIGSDERFFPPTPTGNHFNLEERTVEALDSIRWETPQVKKGLSFHDIFGANIFPYPVQSKLHQIADGPGLYILEAPMGYGKTEAALWAAYKLLQQRMHSGIYFALPTQSTSNKIHERLDKFLQAVIVDKSNARLIHANAWLKEFEYGGEELAPGGSWFHPLKRALLSPFGVGTIDQALLSVLQVRHNFVRTFGLAGKIVILDEVHSYDVYTGALLDRLVERLRALNCTVIILSATLTRERRSTFLSSNETSAGEAYPLITASTKGQSSKSIGAEPPESQTISVSLRSESYLRIALEAVKRATRGENIIWISNTVDESQQVFRTLKAQVRHDAFPVGLLHARFPVWRRNYLEQKWFEMLGHRRHRPSGCILAATQVVEQSVDIDADFMITQLAPTDMMLQRIGRLWRHHRQDRACKEPEVWILTQDLHRATDRRSLFEMLGKSRFVYAPYVLWRSYDVWRKNRRIAIPDKIRFLLEETYRTDDDDCPYWVKELSDELERKKEELRDYAIAMTSEGLPPLSDNEYAPTRYDSHPLLQVLLVKEMDSDGKSGSFLLSNDARVTLSKTCRDPETARMLHLNLVRILQRKEYGRLLKSDDLLKSYISGNTIILRIGEGGRLFNDAEKATPLYYDDEKGVYSAEQIEMDKISDNGKGAGYEFDW